MLPQEITKQLWWRNGTALVIKWLNWFKCEASSCSQSFDLFVLIICPSNDTPLGTNAELYTGQIGKSDGIKGSEEEDTPGKRRPHMLSYNTISYRADCIPS